jgi:hypothetical protein
VDMAVRCRFLTANEADSTGIAQSAPELQSVNYPAAQRY